MGLQDQLVQQDSEVSWVSLDSEEREACRDCQVLRYVFLIVVLYLDLGMDNNGVLMMMMRPFFMTILTMCLVLRVHQGKMELLELQVAKGLLVALVYQELQGQGEMLALRFVQSFHSFYFRGLAYVCIYCHSQWSLLIS